LGGALAGVGKRHESRATPQQERPALMGGWLNKGHPKP